MKKRWVLVAVALAGCDQIPGTSTYKIAQAQQEAAKGLIDPSSAQFRSVRMGKDGDVCGEINAKNRMGAYVGYSRFVATATDTQPSGWLSQIDPQFDPSDEASANELCSSMRSNSYSSAASTASACERAQEQGMNRLMQKLFDQSHGRACN
ncbi:MAG: hypothetical protein JWN21_2403 [Sphingomonas bacterium]|uniref:hypothetical protein n=1 Tax=Sphingomonas bacterium TaxID=1895847 RepID=UPI0026154583|nr:hypothetical protein [Sphingomonas bacterium]MDB5696860.1 hypothetical protein [Sphingomonas bacterium]